MAKWKVLLISLCAFLAGALILLAALVYIPRTTELDYNMRGFIISTDGQILEEFNMTANGKEYDFIIDRPDGQVSFAGNTPQQVEMDTYYLDIQWDSPTISKNGTSGLFTRDFIIPNTQFILGNIDFVNRDTGLFERQYALFDSGSGVFYMYADELAENAFILGITDPDDDPLEILTRYKSVENLLHKPELLPPVEN